MNHKLAESYIKDRLRKHYGRNRVFSENAIAYIGADVEINFYERCLSIYGYRTFNTLTLDYPEKDGYLEETIETIVSVIIALDSLESSYKRYKEVI